ncbi:MAG: DNA-processing protein DprA, partial [Armatimonadota bacterium]|nr:DNA-processing protein DprA [Armatimonadota bacterium]
LLAAVRGGREAELLATPGLTPIMVERLQEAATRDVSKALAAMEEHQIRLMLQIDSDYPAALRSLPDPPPFLFLRGTVEAADEVAVAIVGTRHATEYGRGVAAKLAGDLARRGITIVSGLARGIDTTAHRGALEAGGRTFAVCGCGLDIVYPSDNKKLMQEVTENGAAFSEFAPTVHPEAWHFPARNRIISGLSAGVIIVEAAERSGALITADFALEQGRDVFAVPGNIYKVQSKGVHALIKQGATLIESADDVIAALNNRALPFVQEKKEKAPAATQAAQPAVRADLTALENRVYLALEIEPRHVDDIAESANMGAAEANATLVMLELKNVARRLPGGMFVRVE